MPLMIITQDFESAESGDACVIENSAAPGELVESVRQQLVNKKLVPKDIA
jgi:hypothetical protein